MRRLAEGGRWAVMSLLLTVGSGCAAAAGAAAGAAAAIAYTERNASTEISASVMEVVQSTEAVFRDMGIAVTHRGVSGDEAEIRGDHNGVAITVDIERESDRTTEVVVTAREGELGYRPNHAGDILQRIIDRSS